MTSRSDKDDQTGEGFFDPLFIPWLLNRVSGRYHQRFKKGLKRTGVSLAHWRIIGILHARDGISLSELGDLATVDQPTLSRSIDQMVEKGLVTREPRKNDGRYLSISLTDEGRQTFAKIWPIAWRSNLEGLKQLTDAEQRQLTALLNKVLVSLDDDLT